MIVFHSISSQTNRIGGVMVSLLATSAVDPVKPKIDMCCFSVKHSALRRESKDWLVQNQGDVFE